MGGEFGRLRPTCGPVGVPLGRGRAVDEAAAPCGRVATELAGDRRGRPSDPACDLAHAVALGTEEGDLLALGEGEVPSGGGHRRGSEVGRGHAAGLSEPSGPDRRGHADATRGVLAGQPHRDLDPEPPPVLLARDRGAPRRAHWGSSCLIRTPFPSTHRSPSAGVLRRPVESGQYTSLAFGARCREAGVRPSLGSVGDRFDNAICESFFATIECELLDRRRFTAKAEARSSASSRERRHRRPDEASRSDPLCRPAAAGSAAC